MRLAPRLGLAGLLLFIAATGFAATARIQYLSSSNVYLDAGNRAGLAEGMLAQVEREGRVIAELVVEFVAQNSASCRVLSSSEELRSGDLARFTPALPPSSATDPAMLAQSPPFWSQMGVLHGRVAFLYLKSEDALGTFTNPRLSAHVGWRGPEQRELSLRFRGDRPGNEILGVSTEPRDTRLYEASLRYRSRSQRLELEAGRLLPERLELLGSMDGGGLHWRPNASWRIGLAGGTGADFSSIGFAANGWKLGAFLEARDTGGLWRAILSGGQIEDPDVTRRQFVQLRADARPHQQLRLYENLEVDFSPSVASQKFRSYGLCLTERAERTSETPGADELPGRNTSWKTSLGAPGTELTALSLGAQAWLHRRVDTSFGYEARRPVLDPSHRQLPEVPPRDLLHNFRGSARFRLAPQWSFRLGGDVRLT